MKSINPKHLKFLDLLYQANAARIGIVVQTTVEDRDYVRTKLKELKKLEDFSELSILAMTPTELWIIKKVIQNGEG